MNFRFLSFLFCIIILAGCSSAKKQAELLEQSKPMWLKERPVNRGYYYGIGITPKIGAPMLYEDKAKERALADISSQINATIKSETMMYQVEDRNGVREYLQNRIKSTSSEYLEGYEYIDKWEDLSNMYVFYQLSKQKYIEVKERRRREAIKTATEKYLMALSLYAKGSHIESIENYAWCIDLLSGYMNQSVTSVVDGKQVDLISESTTKMNSIIKLLSIKEEPDKGMLIIKDQLERDVANMPVKLTFSGGYLTNDHVKSDINGFISIPEITDNVNSEETLHVEVDLVNLGRQVTKNLYVRKLIENQKSAKVVMKL